MADHLSTLIIHQTINHHVPVRSNQNQSGNSWEEVIKWYLSNHSVNLQVLGYYSISNLSKSKTFQDFKFWSLGFSSSKSGYIYSYQSIICLSVCKRGNQIYIKKKEKLKIFQKNRVQSRKIGLRFDIESYSLYTIFEFNNCFSALSFLIFLLKLDSATDV